MRLWRGADRFGKERVATTDGNGAIVGLSFAHCDLHLSLERLLELLLLAGCHRVRGAAAATATPPRHSTVGDVPGLQDTLQDLDLQSNERITGSFDRLVAAFSRLRTLNLKRCTEIYGNLHTATAAARTLTSLDLSRCCNMKGDLSSLEGLMHLTELDLYHCSEITGDLVRLSGLQRLRKLGLSHLSKITGSLAAVSPLHSLEILNLSQCCRVTGDLTELAPLLSLAHLWLLGTAVAGDQGLLPLVGCTRLQRLDVSGLPLTGPIPTAMTQIPNLELKIIGTQLRSELREVSVDVAQYPMCVICGCVSTYAQSSIVYDDAWLLRCPYLSLLVSPSCNACYRSFA